MGFDIMSMKQRAKDLMKGATPNPHMIGIIILLCLFACTFVLSMAGNMANSPGMFFVVLAIILVESNIRQSCILYGLKITREEPSDITDAFLAFKKNLFGNLVLAFIFFICAGIGSVLFVIGAAVPAYLFRLSIYLIRDENINPFKAMLKSAKMLKGHYMELLKLDISNIGWFLLTACTLGIASIHTEPYLAIIYAEFYDYVKAQNSLFA